MMINVRKIFTAKKFNYVNINEYFAAKKSDYVDVNRFLNLNSEKNFLLCIIKTFDYITSNEICVAKIFKIFYIFKLLFCD